MFETVQCNIAKKPYYYRRAWTNNITDEELKEVVFAHAVRDKHRHLKLKTLGNKNGKGITYYYITAGFDIETTTLKDKGLAVMYIWQFCINGVVIKGRTYDEFIQLIDRIKTMLNPKQNNRLLCFIHNMSFEFSFLKFQLDFSDAKQNFLKEKREPLKLTHADFLEFRDSMTLCGGDSLAGLAKNYCNTQKAKGDLNYDLVRNHKTQLTPEEEIYCDNDVLILSEFAEYVFNHILPITNKIPLTQTGLLINECKDLLHKEKGNNFEAWQKLNISRSPRTEMDYNIQSNYLYRGGFTHADVLIIEEILNDLLGVDITSSYPYVMTCPIFPKRFEPDEECTEKHLNDIASTKDFICVCEFENIKSTGIHTIESKHKCLELDGATIDNGRVYFARKMKVYLTNFDWISYTHYYKWTSVKITHLEVSERRHLYKHIVIPMLRYYKSKALKKNAGEPYAIDKGRVNSFYGILVKRENGEQTKFDGDFYTEEAQTHEEQVRNSVTCFYDGVFVSAYARYRLLDLAYNVFTKFGIRSVYCDTDSHKFMNPTPELITYIKDLNKTIEAGNREHIAFYTDYLPLYDDLGTWDIEYLPLSMNDGKNAVIKRFKTLGAKRYIIEVEKTDKATGERVTVLNQTVAGLPKGKMLTQYGTIDKCFELFSDDMIIDDCKVFSSYTDEPFTVTVTDYQGNTEEITEKSCNALMPCNFSLTIDKIWKSFYISIADERNSDARETRVIG